MSNLIVRMDRSFLQPFFAHSLRDFGSRCNNWNLFSMESDIPYISEVLATFVACGEFDIDSLSYRFIRRPSLSGGVISFDGFIELNPVALRQVADSSLYSLTFLGRYPKFMPKINPDVKLGLIYQELAKKYPSDTERIPFKSMYENLGPWLEILPNFKESMSLVVKR